MSNEWIEWRGGLCPVGEDVEVVIITRGGTEQQARAEDCYWCHDDDGDDADIIKYRVVREEQPKVEVSKDTNPKDVVGIRKAPLSTVPMNVVTEVGVGMLEGASKYGRHNYRAMGVRSSVYFDATMRHLIDWWEGVDIDPDSNMHHVTKAICSLMVLRDAQMQGMETDDRPPRSKTFYPTLNEKAAGIVDKYADRDPKHWTIKDEIK